MEITGQLQDKGLFCNDLHTSLASSPPRQFVLLFHDPLAHYALQLLQSLEIISRCSAGAFIICCLNLFASDQDNILPYLFM